jgi:HAD superfamily hydrolase (TIGR01509 family)
MLQFQVIALAFELHTRICLLISSSFNSKAMSPTHLIFDCDGVLVDSEVLSAGVLTQMMAEIGFPITDEIFRADFLGRSFANASARAAARFGKPMPDGLQLQYRDRLLSEMRRSLLPMPGVMAVLENLTAPYWLATGSSPQRLANSLDVTGLAPYFEGNCSTASEVAHGKPAPDLLFLAAKRMGVKPETCLVIEDSMTGIEAAIAANMQVWRFMGGSHMRNTDSVETPGSVRQIADMPHLHSALFEAGLCRAPQRG